MTPNRDRSNRQPDNQLGQLKDTLYDHGVFYGTAPAG
jgi:hypothetical protein